jgi:phage baseplate assembly protein W
MIWDPTLAEEVLQNVQSLIATAQGTQPLARALGLPAAACVDAPLPAVQARLASALNAQIKLYEPRAVVSRITVASDGDGRLRPTVRLK